MMVRRFLNAVISDAGAQILSRLDEIESFDGAGPAGRVEIAVRTEGHRGSGREGRVEHDFGEVRRARCRAGGRGGEAAGESREGDTRRGFQCRGRLHRVGRRCRQGRLRGQGDDIAGAVGVRGRRHHRAVRRLQMQGGVEVDRAVDRGGQGRGDRRQHADAGCRVHRIHGGDVRNRRRRNGDVLDLGIGPAGRVQRQEAVRDRRPITDAVVDRTAAVGTNPAIGDTPSTVTRWMESTVDGSPTVTADPVLPIGNGILPTTGICCAG